MADDAPAGLLWGIRSGFRDYLDALPDAEIVLRDARRTAEGFYFPARQAAAGFGGSLRARAHGGELDVTLADPAIEWTAEEGTVLTADLGAGRRTVARLLDADAERLRAGGTAEDVALTLDGSAWLGGVYAPWARMDPVHVLRRHPDGHRGPAD